MSPLDRSRRSPPPRVARDGIWLQCIACETTLAPFDAIRYRCPDCSGLLEVRYADLPTFEAFEGTGVSRYKAALPVVPAGDLGEGGTPLVDSPTLAAELDLDALAVKHEGHNPTGSFKDRGMTLGVAVADRLGVDRLACASTGNTSASLAAYGARAGHEVVVLLPRGNVARGKLAQAAIHGARILEVDGNFDDCLDLVSALSTEGEAYLLNSLNPFRLEGQKTIGLEILEQFRRQTGELPDRIVLPVGNGGNLAALHKAFRELVGAGAMAAEDVPRLTGVQAAGAAPLVEAIESGAESVKRWTDVETIATAIRIGEPVNAPKSLPAVRETGGTAVAVEDAAITAAQRDLAERGIGVEPASAASLAGVRVLREDGTIGPDEGVVCLATGHLLKDPDAAAAASADPTPVAATLESVREQLSSA